MITRSSPTTLLTARLRLTARVTATASARSIYSMPSSITHKVIQSTYPLPTLPRSSFFDYIFPKQGKQAPYPVPPDSAKAFIDAASGRTLTRGQLHEQSLRLGTGLKALGLKRGDTACIFGLNSLEWVVALLGCQAAGIVTTLASYGHTPKELEHQLSNSSSSFIFISPALLPVLSQTPTAKNLSSSRVIVLDPKPSGQFKALHEIYCPQGQHSEPEKFDADGQEHETAVLCYSSGTTGLAKGVETSHYNLTSHMQAVRQVYQPLDPKKDVVMGVLPFCHIFAFAMCIQQPLTQGVPVIVLPKFEETLFLTSIEKYKITWALLVPPILVLLANSPSVDKYDLSTLRGIISGAAPLGKDLALKVAKRLKERCFVIQGYGLTETTPVVHLLPLEDAIRKVGSIGRLIPTLEARLITEGGEDAEAGQPGELWIRGPTVMKGYLKNEKSTKDTFQVPGEEGGEWNWFKTGDVAVVDEEGYFRIVDRVKELIKYKGYQVPPAELEALLLTHPKIGDSGVCGVWSKDQATELPRAYVVPLGGIQTLKTEADKTKFSQEIIEWVAKNAANPKRLRGGCVVLEAIPKSASGKILRRELRVLAAQEEQRLAAEEKDKKVPSRESKL